MAGTAVSQGQLYTAWPPDDTEESVAGSDRHQMTIINLRLGMNELAHAAVQPGLPVPWHALSQTVLLGCRRRSGTDYSTMPDVFVYKEADRSGSWLGVAGKRRPSRPNCGSGEPFYLRQGS